MRAAVALALLALPGLLRAASPCAGVERNLDEAEQKQLAPVIGRQLQLRGVVLKQALRSASWQVFLVGVRDADDSYVFYDGDPLSQRYIDAIGTFALPEGEAAIRRWLRDTFEALPEDLAQCLAHEAATRQR